MAKNKKYKPTIEDAEQIAAGRVRLGAPELIALIRHVNPTGLDLGRNETARRYALKNRLQSALIRQCPDDIEPIVQPNEPGVVLLHHRPLGMGACHTVLAELDDDVRSHIQHLLDTSDAGTTHSEEKSRVSATSRRNDPIVPDIGDGDVDALLRDGETALESYDYDVARQRFEEAFVQSSGRSKSARALFTLLIEQLGADADALTFEERLAPETKEDVDVRGLLAIAAARHGDRERALHHVEMRGPQISLSRHADIFVHLSKHALVHGDFVQAAKDIARVKEMLPAHPELNSLFDALTRARAQARAPEEAELNRMFTAGDSDGAAAGARALLERFPDSDVARRILHAIDEQKKQNDAQARLQDAQRALELGDDTRAFSALRAALQFSLSENEIAWVRARLSELERQARAYDEEAKILEVQQLLQSEKQVQGLTAYARLPESGRRKVETKLQIPYLSWLNALCPPGEHNRIPAGIAAVLALQRAAQILPTSPSAALDAIAAHDKILRDFGPAEEIRRAAHREWTEQQRTTALGRLEMVRRALLEGDMVAAERHTHDTIFRFLKEEDTRTLTELKTRIHEALERRALYDAVEHARKTDPVRALSLVKRLLQRPKDDEAEKLREVQAQLRAQTRQAFLVHIEEIDVDASNHPESRILFDARILPKRRLDGLLIEQRGDTEEVLFVIPQAKAEWIFIRIFDVSSGKVRTRVRLRTPIAMDPIHYALRERRLFLVGRSGSLLEIDLDDWAIVQWSANVLRPAERIKVVESVPGLVDLSVPDLVVEEAVVSLDGNHLWMNTVYGRAHRDQIRRFVHIFEIDGFHLVRDLRAPPRSVFHCQAIPGLESPVMAVVDEAEELDSQRTILHEPRGRLLENWTVPMGIDAPTLVPTPNGKFIFGATSDPEGPDDASTARWGFLEMRPGGPTPLHLLTDITAVYQAVAATSFEMGMIYLLFSMLSGNELFGLRQTSDGLEIAYRVRVPRYSALLATPDARRAVLMVLRGCEHEFLCLGPTPPHFDVQENANPFLLPRLPIPTLFATRLECHAPVGARAARTAALEHELRIHGRARYNEFLRSNPKKSDPDELLLMEEALLRTGHPQLAGDVGAYASRLWPQHPRVRLGNARHRAAVGLWSEVLTLLEGIDATTTDEASAKHAHHLRGIAKMMMHDVQGAIDEFDRCIAIQEGTCDPGELLALCIPISDTTRTWTDETQVVRDYVACLIKADAALAEGDLAAARAAIDVPLIWEAFEVQSHGRLAETYLRGWEQGIEHDVFHTALVLLGFCELVMTRRTMTAREAPFPQNPWQQNKIDDVVRRARMWIEKQLEGQGKPTMMG